ncbi:hypothetical protein J6590_069838 [Homalodisca vitripennis]|nr:hypothetical protein J6590_069838 [Homalodisca vitripennis]
MRKKRKGMKKDGNVIDNERKKRRRKRRTEKKEEKGEKKKTVDVSIADGNKANDEKGVRAHQYPFLCFVRNKLVCVDCLPLS